MQRLTGDQRKSVIDAALSVLDRDSLEFKLSTGKTIQYEMRAVIENTLDRVDGDSNPGYNASDIIGLLRDMFEAAVDEITRQTGMSPADVAFAARGSEGSDTLQ